MQDEGKKAVETGGTVYSNVSNASTAYGENKFHANRGHGFAAERVNHLYDKLHGKDARIIGDDNAKNGADRIVDGINIQSKYCSTGSKCIGECFTKDLDGNVTLRYLNSDGTPMQIEVPSDKYIDAVRAMEERIKRGQVPGINDPGKAKDIVRKGQFTYEQAKNIAKFGTVESLTYDAVNGMIVGGSAFCLTFMITFAVSIWHGKNVEDALKEATFSGVKVGGVAFLTSVLTGQLTKAGVITGITKGITKGLGYKGSAILVNAFRSGKNIYGAAAKSTAQKMAQKMMSSNLVTAIASIIVLSTFDVVKIFRGRISFKQLCKNVINTTGAVVGGTAGWAAGAAAGAKAGAALGTASIPIPVVGTVTGATIGGIAGSVVGGYLGGKATVWASDKLIEDDANEMIKIIEKEFKDLAISYILNEEEAKETVNKLAEGLTLPKLQDMYKSQDRHTFAKNLVIPCIEEVVRNRKHITLPNQEQIEQSIIDVFEEFNRNGEDINIELELRTLVLLREGARYYKARRYNAAVECFRKAAKEGMVVTQYKMGWCCRKGKGLRIERMVARYL